MTVPTAQESIRPRARGGFRLVLLIVVAIALGGCTARLAWNFGDRLIVHEVNKIVSLDREQKASLRTDARALLDWHCATQMPAYDNWLATLGSELADPDRDPALDQHIDQLSTFWDTLITRLWPVAADALAGFSPEQIEALAEYFREDIEEGIRDYVEPDLHTRYDERTESMSERLEGLLGDLEPAQVERVERWSREIEPYEQPWMDNRARWQAALIEAFEMRDDRAAFDRTIEHLLVEPERLHSDDYRALIEVNAERTLRALSDVMALRTDRQQEHLAQRLSRFQDSTRKLACADEDE
jgi:hypothetical protein